MIGGFPALIDALAWLSSVACQDSAPGLRCISQNHGLLPCRHRCGHRASASVDRRRGREQLNRYAPCYPPAPTAGRSALPPVPPTGKAKRPSTTPRMCTGRCLHCDHKTAALCAGRAESARIRLGWH